MVETQSEQSPRPELKTPNGLRLIETIHSGRRSQWFQAEQVSLGRTVALKYLHPVLSESEKLRSAFFAAARQAAAIVHPAALSVINVYRDHNCIAMQLAKGRPIRELRHSLEPVQACLVGEAVMDALSSLHATDRCHGNLTPGNVFLNQDEVEIGDFFQPPELTDGAVCFVGEREFIAPEVVGGAGRDWASDVFSLGQILAFAVDPKNLDGEILSLIDRMRHGDPRGNNLTPESILDAFRRLRKEEEARLGLDPAARRGKRMYRRVPAGFEVSLCRRSATPEETATILMKIRDIGESGVFVETDDDLIGIGSILELDFGLKGVDGNVHAFGIVRWRSSPPMPKGVGVQFVEVDQDGLNRLRRFILER